MTLPLYFPLILLVDDDPIITRTLAIDLDADGFEVVTAATASEALRWLERRLPDLAVVDLLLPDMHGFELSRKIKSYNDLPIVMLTAVGTEQSIVAGLEQYAEDYIVKPFSYKQLLARITRVLKRTRMAKPFQDVVRICDEVEVDFARHIVTINGRESKLTPTESRALACLVRHANQVVSGAALMEAVWEDGEGDETRLRVLIKRLREKVEPNPCEPCILLNERGMGYKLEINRQ